jgi:ParB/RepB/Spo0J family partition protein
MKVSDIIVGENFSREDIGNIDSLVHSISLVGLLSPLVVDEDGRLVAGFRRYRAIKSLGWEDVQVVVTESKKAGLANLMENLERKQLTFYEEAQALRRLFPGVEFKEIAETLSMSATWVRRRMRFWELPAEIIKMAKDGDLTVNQVSDLIDSKDPMALLEHIQGKTGSEGRRVAGKTVRPSLKDIKVVLTECVSRGCNDAAQALLYCLGDLTEEQFFDSIGRD